MPSIKLSVTCRRALAAKYEAAALARIDAAVAAWIKADRARGITTIHLALDDAAAMKRHKVPAITGTVTPHKVKKALDALVARLAPDYIVLFGAGDVVPPFRVRNPTQAEDGEAEVLTDNPYASSRPFRATRLSSYLIPDRVIGRIPDMPNSSDPSWLVDYLAVASAWKAGSSKRYADALMVCCDAWKNAGRECVKFLARDLKTLLISPPAATASKKIVNGHGAAVHMLKCHGAENDSQFYGQKGTKYPPVLRSTALLKRTKVGTIAAAMCCFGASVFDPDDAANVWPGEPPIPSVYLKQGAFGFLGSTTTAWVGDQVMMCGDWIVASFLKAVMGGASLGRATLESKQDLVRWEQTQGNDLDAADEKTLLQFVLLGDPAIHPVKAATPAGVVSASMLGAAPTPASAVARQARRAARLELGAMLRSVMPEVTPVRAARVPPQLHTIARTLVAEAGDGNSNGAALGRPRVEKRVRPVGENLQYYWASRHHEGRVRTIRVVSIQADTKGNVLRTHVLVSS